MKRYPKYKDSGISWLGQIPEHWDVKRAKFMFLKNKRKCSEGDEVITCFRDGQVTLRKNRRTTGFTESEKYDGYQGIKKGDLVIHQMDAFAGSIGNYYIIVTKHLDVSRLTDSDPILTSSVVF